MLPPSAVTLLQPEDAAAAKGESWSERAKHFLRRDSFLRRAGSKGAKKGNASSEAVPAPAQDATTPGEQQQQPGNAEERQQTAAADGEDDSSLAGGSPKSADGPEGACGGSAARWAAFWAERNGSGQRLPPVPPLQQVDSAASGQQLPPEQPQGQGAAEGLPQGASPSVAPAAEEEVIPLRLSSSSAPADASRATVPASPRSDSGRGGFMAAVSGYVSRYYSFHPVVSPDEVPIEHPYPIEGYSSCCGNGHLQATPTTSPPLRVQQRSVQPPIDCHATEVRLL